MTNYDRTGRIVSPAAPLVGPRCRVCHRQSFADVHTEQWGHQFRPLGRREERAYDLLQVSNVDGPAHVLITEHAREIDDLHDLVSQLRRDAGV